MKCRGHNTTHDLEWFPSSIQYWCTTRGPSIQLHLANGCQISLTNPWYTKARPQSTSNVVSSLVGLPIEPNPGYFGRTHQSTRCIGPQDAQAQTDAGSNLGSTKDHGFVKITKGSHNSFTIASLHFCRVIWRHVESRPTRFYEYKLETKTNGGVGSMRECV